MFVTSDTIQIRQYRDRYRVDHENHVVQVVTRDLLPYSLHVDVNDSSHLNMLRTVMQERKYLAGFGYSKNNSNIYKTSKTDSAVSILL